MATSRESPMYPVKVIEDDETECSPRSVSGKSGLDSSLKSLPCAASLS